MNILVTGANGLVGQALIGALFKLNSTASEPVHILAGLRKPQAEQPLSGLREIQFDFGDKSSVQAALSQTDCLFLLRPPELTDVERYFQPLIQEAKNQGLKHIVFLSVQGAEHSAWIPHRKIEKLIIASGLPYTFLRPAYFMQNFLTNLHKDLVVHDRIFLPAGQAKFNLIDVEDLGVLAAEVLCHPEQHRYQAYALSTAEPLSFEEMANILSQELGRPIRYYSPSPWCFYRQKRHEGLGTGLILVMIMLHYLPRFRTALPPCPEIIRQLLHREPTAFEDFLRRQPEAFRHSKR